jgi:transposase
LKSGNQEGAAMATEGRTFEQWLGAAGVSPKQLNDHQKNVLKAFQFLQKRKQDYASMRIVGYFLLRCDLGLKVDEIARLVGISARSAFRHRNLSSTQVVQQIQHRMNGRPYGKLLPRHAGPIAEFLFTHPQASRQELLDFIGRTWEFRVSKVALWEFLKKLGLDRASLAEVREATSDDENQILPIESFDEPSAGRLVPVVPDDFFWPDAICRSLPAVAPSPRLARHGGRRREDSIDDPR